jgi:hypothetical protein
MGHGTGEGGEPEFQAYGKWLFAPEKLALACARPFFPTDKSSLSVGKSFLSVGKLALAVGKSSLAVGKSFLSVGKPALAVGEFALAVRKNGLSVGKLRFPGGKAGPAVGPVALTGGVFPCLSGSLPFLDRERAEAAFGAVHLPVRHPLAVAQFAPPRRQDAKVGKCQFDKPL